MRYPHSSYSLMWQKVRKEAHEFKSKSRITLRFELMKLYVCWGAFGTPVLGHPCHTAHQALLAAGYEPEVVKVYGHGVGPRLFHWTTDGRREVEALSGQKVVPVLVTDAGEVVTESRRIVEWAVAYPKSQPAAA